MLYVLNNDDGIIDDETDGEHHRKERQRIDGKIQEDECAECTDERDRHGEQRDNRCAPALQEDEDDEHDEQQCLDEGVNHLFDGGIDVVRAVKDRLHLEPGRERLLRLRKHLAYLGKGNHRIRIRGEPDTETDGRVAVELRDDIVLPLARLDACHILQADERAVLARGDDDVAELLRRRQASLHLARKLFFLPILCRHTADGSGRSLHVLLLDRRRDVRNGQSELSEAVRIQPDAHRIVRAKDLHVADAADALDRIEEVERRVVLHKGTVIPAVLGVHRNKVRHLPRGFTRCDPRRLHRGGQARVGTGGVVLHLDRVHIAVRTDIKGDREAVASGIIRGGAHVVHSLCAVDLLLDDLCDRLIDNGGTRARIGCRHRNRRRRNLRILRNRQRKASQRSDDNNDQGDNNRKDRSVNEKFCQRISSLLRGRRCARIKVRGISLKRESHIVRRHHRHREIAALLEGREPFDNDRIRGIQTVLYDVVAANLVPEGDRAGFCLVVCTDDHDEGFAEELLHGTFGNEECIWNRIADQRNAREHARQEEAVRIVKERLDRQRARLCRQRAISRSDTPGDRIL